MTLHACLCELQQIPSEQPSAGTRKLEACGPAIEVLSSWHGITTL
jgi:hypothetical protein